MLIFFEEKADEAYEKYLNTYLKDFHILKSYSGVRETLSYMSSLKIPLFIISNKEKALLNKEVKHLFADITFLKILGNGDAEHNKPHPAPVIEAIKDTNINLELDTVWFIGDTKQDTECAYASGCIPFLIGEGGFTDNEYISKKKNALVALNVFNDFLDFFQWLQSVNFIKSSF